MGRGENIYTWEDTLTRQRHTSELGIQTHIVRPHSIITMTEGKPHEGAAMTLPLDSKTLSYRVWLLEDADPRGWCKDIRQSSQRRLHGGYKK
jgi:hypothetical protein